MAPIGELLESVNGLLAERSVGTAREDLFTLLTSTVGGEITEVLFEELLIAECFGRLEVDHKEQGRALRDFSGLTPREAIAWFKEKKIVAPSEFKRMTDRAKTRAFTVAGLTQRYTLERVHGELTTALEDGLSQRQTLARIREQYKSWGLTPKSSHHLATVFRTNVLASYSAGRYRQMRRLTKTRPYWQYRTAGDSRVRPEHVAMDGKVYPASDPVWATWFPPNGFMCRCAVESLSKQDIEDEQLQPESGPPKVEPDKGFHGSPAVDKDVDKSIASLRRQMAAARVFRAPRLASTLGRAVHASAGDLVRPRAKVVDDLASVRSALVTQLAEENDRFSIGARAVKPKGGAMQIRIPVPSQHMDSLEQLAERMVRHPRLKGTRLRLSTRATYQRGAAKDPTAATKDGIARWTEVILVVSVAGAAAAVATKLALEAEAGHGAAIRRAPDVSDLVVRGKSPGAGFVEALLASRKMGSGWQQVVLKRGTTPSKGWTTEKVWVTQARGETL